MLQIFVGHRLPTPLGRLRRPGEAGGGGVGAFEALGVGLTFEASGGLHDLTPPQHLWMMSS